MKNAVLSLSEFEDYGKVANIIKKWDEKSCINSIKKFQFDFLNENI